MKSIDSKVCIIGSGPGGLVTSMFLSKYKIPHLLVDKSSFPRDKVCGENMDGRVASILNRVNPEIMADLKSKGLVQETWDFHITLPKGKVPISFSKNSAPRLLSKRIDFDNFLFEKAISSDYCEEITDCAITNYRYDGDRIVFEGKGLEITSDIGVVACGYQSSLLKNRQKEGQMYFFNRLYYKNAIGFDNNQIQTYYFDQPAKCCLLIVPLPNNEFNVDLGISKLEYKNLKIRLEDLLQILIEGDQILSKWFSTATIFEKPRGIHTPIASKYKHFSDRNLVYVGGTAFCVNPITGMGIGNAMAMAEIAAGEIQSWIKEDRFLAKDTFSYEQKARKKLRNVIVLNTVINLFFSKLDTMTPILLVLVKWRFIVKLLSTSSLLNNITKPGFYLKKMFTKG
jgi:flavin-dependent dehydrogenase